MSLRKEMIKIFLTELIGGEFKVWGGCDDIFIETPTGSGKTTFVLQVLSNYAMEQGKEVLLIVNRKILKNQIKQELAKEHVMENVSSEELAYVSEFAGITIVSYQELQEELKRKSEFLCTLFASRYMYIVFDECHFFLQDATFNRDIEYLVRVIPLRRNAAKIFLSATMDEVKPFLLDLMHPEEQLWKIRDNREKQILAYRKTLFTGGRIFFYSQKPEFRIQSVKYFHELVEISDLINEDKSGEKWLIFVNSKNEARVVKNAITRKLDYLDAEVDENDPVKQQIVAESKFEVDVLVTTKVLDNGVNLIDERLQNIVLLTTEKTEFLQMLGRKRFMENEKGVKLYITCRSVRYFNARRNGEAKINQKFIEEVEKNPHFHQGRLDDINFVNFLQKIVIIEGNRLTVSRAAKEKLRLQEEFCDLIIKKLKEDPEAFVKEQISWIGESFDPLNYLNCMKDKMKKIIKFLEQVAGKEMDKDEQEKFRRRFGELAVEYGVKLTDRENRLVGKAKINSFCKESGITFEIKAIKNSQYWIVKEVKNNEEKMLHN